MMNNVEHPRSFHQQTRSGALPQRGTSRSFHLTPVSTTTTTAMTANDEGKNDQLSHQRRERAAEYMTTWISQNSFYTAASGCSETEQSSRERSSQTFRGLYGSYGYDTNSNSDSDADASASTSSSSHDSEYSSRSRSDDEEDDSSHSSSISSVSISLISQDEEDSDDARDDEGSGGDMQQEEEEELPKPKAKGRRRISIGLNVSTGDLEVYEDDDFNASSYVPNAVPPSQRYQQKRRNSIGKSKSFYDPKRISLQEELSSQQQNQEPKKSHSSYDYLPSSLRTDTCSTSVHVPASPTKITPPQPIQPHPSARPTSTHTTQTSSSSTGPSIVSSSTGNLVASRMPWRDHHEIQGQYTGQVNENMKPHGPGALVYKDGSAETSIWHDGLPGEFWTPEMKKIMPEVEVIKKNKQQGGSKDKDGKTNKKSWQKKNKQLAKSNQVAPSTSTQPQSQQATAITSSRASTYLPHLDLGDAGSPKDMIPHSLQSSIDSLQIHDFAFILRSDNQWTYAIIAERHEDTIRFVVDVSGSAKFLSRKRWNDCIRLVNPESTTILRRRKKGETKKTTKKNEKVVVENGNKKPYKKQRSI